MAYYRITRRAKVFAAGVPNFANRTGRSPVDRLIENVFAKLEVR